MSRVSDATGWPQGFRCPRFLRSQQYLSPGRLGARARGLSGVSLAALDNNTLFVSGLARTADAEKGTVLLGTFYIEANHSRYREYFPNPISEPADIAYFVRDNTGYRDIVFCHSFEIPALSVELLSYSNKRVYPAQTLADIYSKTRRLDERDRDYMINLLVLKEDQELSARMRDLMSRGHETRRSGSLRLVRMEPEAFRRLIRNSEMEPSRVLLRNDTHEYSLVRALGGAAQESILRSNGETIRIVPGAMDGAVETVQQEDARTWFRGWASDGDRRKPADRVVAFVDGESNHEEHVEVRRVYIAADFQAPALRQAGFRVELLWPVFESAPPPVVRVFAISAAGLASERSYRLEYYDNSRRLRLGSSARAIRYSIATDGETLAESLVSPDGKTIRIVAAAMDGSVDVVEQQEGRTRLGGWASDSAHRTSVDRIAVFVNGEADHHGHTAVSRSDLVEGFGSPSMMQAGFDVVLSEPAFEQDQPPVVRVFAISTTSVATELWYRSEYPDGSHQRRLGTNAREIRYSLLTNQDTSEIIVSPRRETVRVVSGTMDGAVDVVRQQDGRTQISGWASDGDHRRPADQVAVFVDGEANHYGHNVVGRRDLVKAFGSPSIVRAGFDVVLPGLVLDRDPPPVVRVFAISSATVAAELRYLSEYSEGDRTVKLGKH